MGWAAKFGDRQVPFEDLPIAVVQKVAAKHRASWLDLVTYPGNDLSALHDLLVAAAEQLEVEPPAVPATVREGRVLLAENVVKVDDDLPSMWTDGDPPEGDQTTE